MSVFDEYHFSLGLFKLPRGHQPINCDDVIDDILEFLDGYEEFFPGEFQMALHDNYLSDEFSDDTKKQNYSHKSFVTKFLVRKKLHRIDGSSNTKPMVLSQQSF